MDEVDQRAVFAAAYGTHFALELKQRIADGIPLSNDLLISVAHAATSVARAAIQGLRELGKLTEPMLADQFAEEDLDRS